MNNEKIIFGQYINTNSFIHKLDPRLKIILTFVFILSLFIVKNIYILFILTFFLLLLIFLTKINFTRFIKSISKMSYILIFTFVMQIIDNQNGNLLASYNFDLNIINLLVIVIFLVFFIFFVKYIRHYKISLFILFSLALFYLQTIQHNSYTILFYNIKIYEEGLTEAIFIMLRLIDFIILSGILTYTTKPTEINLALDKILKPFNKIFNVNAFTMIISIALRFIPNLLTETEKVLKAQSARGFDYKEANLIEKIKEITNLVIPLFVISYKKGMDLTYAMISRGYDETKARSSIYELKYTRKDIFTYLITIGFLCFLLIFNFIL